MMKIGLIDYFSSIQYFSYAEIQNLKSTNRSSQFIDQFKNFNVDILCLQEVDNLKFYQEPKDKLNYDICYLKRPD
ncbi:unnamed protein product [Paramecium primaurelia]|uniref:Uncharacterized protein n=1 Tax=Paramecium primaurelia TaxID=5886 RepID=A0A8S1KHN6_PARPR|nr:unnamed protein product [Paramecium primaurelia]